MVTVDQFIKIYIIVISLVTSEFILFLQRQNIFTRQVLLS